MGDNQGDKTTLYEQKRLEAIHYFEHYAKTFNIPNPEAFAKNRSNETKTTTLKANMEKDIATAFRIFENSTEDYPIKAQKLIQGLAILRFAYELKAQHLMSVDKKRDDLGNDKIDRIRGQAFDREVDNYCSDIAGVQVSKASPGAKALLLGTPSIYIDQVRNKKDGERFKDKAQLMRDVSFIDALIKADLNNPKTSAIALETFIKNNSGTGATEESFNKLKALAQQQAKLNNHKIRIEKQKLIDSKRPQLSKVQRNDKINKINTLLSGMDNTAAAQASKQQRKLYAEFRNDFKKDLKLDAFGDDLKTVASYFIGNQINMYKSGKLTRMELVQNLGKLQQALYLKAQLTAGAHPSSYEIHNFTNITFDILTADQKHRTSDTSRVNKFLDPSGLEALKSYTKEIELNGIETADKNLEMKFEQDMQPKKEVKQSKSTTAPAKPLDLISKAIDNVISKYDINQASAQFKMRRTAQVQALIYARDQAKTPAEKLTIVNAVIASLAEEKKGKVSGSDVKKYSNKIGSYLEQHIKAEITDKNVFKDVEPNKGDAKILARSYTGHLQKNNFNEKVRSEGGNIYQHIKRKM